MSEKCTVIILAAGTSSRMKGKDKLWYSAAGDFVISHTIAVFNSSPFVDTIVIVTNPSRLEDTIALCTYQGWEKVSMVIPGGSSRSASSCLGIETAYRITPDMQWLMIHDAARPLVKQELLERGLEMAKTCGAAVPVVAVKDTIKEVVQGQVQRTPDRSTLWVVQTPQIFSAPLIRAAYADLIDFEGITDDATVVERYGHPVMTFPGSYTNIKITTPEDLVLLQAFLQEEKLS